MVKIDVFINKVLPFVTSDYPATHYLPITPPWHSSQQTGQGQRRVPESGAESSSFFSSSICLSSIW